MVPLTLEIFGTQDEADAFTIRREFGMAKNYLIQVLNRIQLAKKCLLLESQKERSALRMYRSF